MTVIDPERVRALFPELPDLAAVQELLEAVSNRAVDSLPSPRHELDELDRIPDVQDQVPASEYVGFDNFSRLVCSDQRGELRKMFAQLDSTREHCEQLAETMWKVLVERVQELSARTLVSVMHVLREQGRLHGETSEDRYRYFCILSGSAGFAEVLATIFPGLSTQIECVISGFISAISVFLARLDEAISAGSLKGMIGADPTLQGLRWAGSDPHSGGQSVLIAEFRNGNRRLVYKPRSMEAEVAFAELVRRFNRHASIGLPVLEIVPGAGHGWQEHADGDRTEDAEKYYRDSGHLLAILHLVGASDMHYENVLNHRGSPVVVDAETLFSVNMRRSEDGGSVDPAMLVLAESVFSTGFLPSRIDTADIESDSVDIGFLGYEPGQTAITASATFREFGTDRMYVDFDMGHILDPSSLPRTDALMDEPGIVADAFCTLYDWILGHQSTVASWMEQLFAHVHVRAVLDNTRKYYQLLSLATHPEFHMSPELTETLFHRCGIGRLDHVTPTVIRAEIADLLRRDIPYFTLRTDSTEVFDARGTVIVNALAQPPLSQALERLKRMSPMKRDFNARTIRSTFVNKTSPELDRPEWEQLDKSTKYHSKSAPPLIDLQVVRDIADEYVRFVIEGTKGKPAEWIGSTLSNTVQVHPWRYRQLGDGLYAGRSGLALFLAAAGERFQDNRYIDCAEGFLLPRAHELLTDSDERRSRMVGGFGDGYPSIVYSLINGGRLTGRTEWETAGLRLWSMIPHDIQSMQETDQLMGSAGLLTLSSWLLSDPSIPASFRNHVEDAAASSYAALCTHAEELNPGPGTGRIYSGYAHGLAGLIAALTVYGKHHSGARVQARALEEDFSALFEDTPVRWAISNDAPGRKAHGWCHGAPGILVGEQIRQVHGQQDREEIIDALIALVLDECLDLNLSLCHGDIGNLVILQHAARLRNDSSLRDATQGMCGQLAEQIVPRKLAKRNAKTLLNDSLMVGLPGVGYGLLQLEANGALPDIFTYGLIH